MILTIAAVMGATLLNASGVGFTLGQAGGYAALILPGGSLNLTVDGGAALVGSAAVSANAHLDLGSGAKVGPMAGTGQVIDGMIYLDPNGATVKLANQDPLSVATRDLSQAVQDAITANTFAAGLAATRTFSSGLDITSPFTIVGNGGLNVISLSDLKLHSNGLLTLQGSASDIFIFNLTGTYSQSGPTSVALSGGLLSQNVIWNFIGTGNGANIGTGLNGVTYGTFLAPFRDFSITDTILYGSVITAGHLAIASQALVISQVPEISPAWFSPCFLALLCAVHCIGRRRAAVGVCVA
jgi:choice-of-anchor A domain-containing protein